MIYIDYQKFTKAHKVCMDTVFDNYHFNACLEIINESYIFNYNHNENYKFFVDSSFLISCNLIGSS